ncbi:restriction endonuclease subunit S [Bacillaceae bacterium S4-13-58]
MSWKKVKIGDLCHIRRGASPRPINNFISPSGTGLPWVKIADATSSNSRYIEKTKEFIIEDGIKKTVVVEPGTFILSNSATPGLPKFMKIKAGVHDGWLVLSDFKDVLKEYLYYLFIYKREQLLLGANGSVFNNLKTDTVRDFEVLIPDSIDIQKRIVNILSNLDDKIELNNQMNQTLEETTMTLYKHWFVDFGPFQDGEFVESELGMIPKGWEVGKLGDLYDTSSGGTPSRKKQEYYDNGNINWIKTKELEDGFIFSSEEKVTEQGLKNSSAKVFPVGTVLIAMYGATVGQLGILGVESSTNQACCALLKRDDLFNEVFAYLYLLNNRKRIIGLANGGAQQNINQQLVRDLSVVIPPKKVMSNVGEQLSKLFELKMSNELEISQLTETRNYLLPKLLSGEIDLSKTEREVEKVL